MGSFHNAFWNTLLGIKSGYFWWGTHPILLRFLLLEYFSFWLVLGLIWFPVFVNVSIWKVRQHWHKTRVSLLLYWSLSVLMPDHACTNQSRLGPLSLQLVSIIIFKFASFAAFYEKIKCSSLAKNCIFKNHTKITQIKSHPWRRIESHRESSCPKYVWWLPSRRRYLLRLAGVHR